MGDGFQGSRLWSLASQNAPPLQSMVPSFLPSLRTTMVPTDALSGDESRMPPHVVDQPTGLLGIIGQQRGDELMAVVSGHCQSTNLHQQSADHAALLSDGSTIKGLSGKEVPNKSPMVACDRKRNSQRQCASNCPGAAVCHGPKGASVSGVRKTIKLMRSSETFGIISTLGDDLKNYTAMLENNWFGLAQLACTDHDLCEKISSFIPPGMLEIARESIKAAALLSDHGDGYKNMVPPVRLKIVRDAIGGQSCCKMIAGCSHVAPVLDGQITPSCTDGTCSTARFTDPPKDLVLTDTNWILYEANARQLSRCWFGTLFDPVREMDGNTMKMFLYGHELGLEIVAAATNLFRSMESKLGKWGAPHKIRHYVDPEWGTMVIAGGLTGTTSMQCFCSPEPQYPLHMVSKVFVPAYVAERWACYVIDVDNRIITVLDPNMHQPCKEQVICQEKMCHTILVEVLRCMRILTKYEFLGDGSWEGSILLPSKELIERIPGGSSVSVISSIWGFNERYVCDSDNEVDSAWFRRKLIYMMLNMEGNKAYGAWESQVRGLGSDADRSSAVGA